MRGIGWALFDPNQDLPKHLGGLPEYLEQYATYNPGNTRILEYHIHSQSVRIKSTPPFLQQGHTIEYTKTGPKLIEMAVPVKKPRGRPRKHPLPSNRLADVVRKPVSVGTKPGRPLGRPRKQRTQLPESEDSSEVEEEGSMSPLTEFEEEEGEDDYVEENIAVTPAKGGDEVEIGDSEDELMS